MSEKWKINLVAILDSKNLIFIQLDLLEGLLLSDAVHDEKPLTRSHVLLSC